MPRISILVASVVCTFLLGAVEAMTAYATFEITTVECTGSGIPTLCIEGAGGKLFEARGTEKYVGKLTTGTEAIFGVAALGLEIACNKDVSEGEVIQNEPLVASVVAKKGFLTFSECKMIGTLAKSCKVPTTLKSNALQGEVIDEMPINAGVALAETGKTILTITIEDEAGETCPATIMGTNSVSGEDLCLSAEAEVDQAVHKGECTRSGSKLKFAGSAAFFECKGEGELAGANKEKKWDVTLA